MSSRTSSERAALEILQSAISILIKWYGSPSPELIRFSLSAKLAQSLMGWSAESQIGPLRLLFDGVKLSEHSDLQQNWCQLGAISNKDPIIPYPSVQRPTEEQINVYKLRIKEEIDPLQSEFWDNPTLLALLIEKYGSCLSFGDTETAFCDRVRMTAAIAAPLAQADSPETVTDLCLVAADLSGIQDFIYTISSDGALKSLRARSFYLELVTEEIVQQLLTALHLPRTSIIYSGGGKLFLLASARDATASALDQICDRFGPWLLKKFQAKISLSLDSHNFPIADIGIDQNRFSEHWEAVIRKLSFLKSRKFEHQIVDVLKTQTSHEPCKVCHRDDEPELKPLGIDGPESCSTCQEMWHLGDSLFDVEVMVRSYDSKFQDRIAPVELNFGDQPVYYHLFQNAKAITQQPEAVYLINNWQINDYVFHNFKNATLFLLGNYAFREDRKSFMTAEDFAVKAQGINRVGYLRMDVDRLGQIFARGLGEQHTLPKLAGLSRQVSYFFKVYLNSLAKDRKTNFLDHASSQQFKFLSNSNRRDLLFIYAGGDDLFVSGAWDQIAEFAQDVYQCFCAFTGFNPDITLSAGISINLQKYPLYQAAEDSGNAEKAAKHQGRNRLSLFGEVFQWGEWLGKPEQIASAAYKTENVQDYLRPETRPQLFGVVPLAQKLNDQLDQPYSRSFVQNLLVTAQVQERQIEIAQKQAPEQVEDIKYFLHLPRIAYTLARLPNQTTSTRDFEAISSSLKSQHNAPFFRAIATWISLLNRISSPPDS